MTPEQISLIQGSFLKVVPIHTEVAALFYGRLFELDPSLRRLFAGDMNRQGRKLMAAIAFVVDGLSDAEGMLPAVRDLGRRHAGYGAEARHYDTVGAALLWALEQGLGDGFTQDVERAWTAAYDLLASVMIEAADRKAA